MVVRREEEKKRISVNGEIIDSDERTLFKQGDSQAATIPAKWLKKVATAKLAFTLIHDPAHPLRTPKILIEFVEESD